MGKMTRKEAAGIAEFWGDLPVEGMDLDEAGEAQDLWSEHYDRFTLEVSDLVEESGFDLNDLLDNPEKEE